MIDPLPNGKGAVICPACGREVIPAGVEAEFSRRVFVSRHMQFHAHDPLIDRDPGDETDAV